MKRKGNDFHEEEKGGVEEEEFGDKRQRGDFSEPSRALYIGSINASASPHIYSDLCALANEYGPLEMVKVVPQKGCAFINFIDEVPATAFMQAAEQKSIQLGDSPLKVRWAKAAPLPAELLEKVKEGATRNLFIGALAETANEDALAHFFHRYGPIESIVILRPKAIAFVNLTSIRSAIAARDSLDGKDLNGRRIKVNFAKEKVGVKYRPVPVPRQQPTETRSSRAPPEWPTPPPRELPGYYPAPYPAPYPTPAYAPPPPPPQLYPSPLPAAPASRAVFLGNVQDDVTLSDICKLANRYGAVESVKVIKAKSSAFVNFVEPSSAAAFVSAAQVTPVTLAGQPIRVNWGKSAPLHQDLLAQVRSGATRNLFVGNVDDHISEEQLREVFGPFGEFDSVVIIRGKKIAFVNFASLKSALKARDHLQGTSVGDPPVTLKINFAKEVIPGSRPRGPRQYGTP